MKILHVIPTYLPAWRHGGPVYAVHGLARALTARGHDVTVFTTDVHGDGTLGVAPGAPVERDGVAVRYFPVRPPRRLYRSPALAAALAPGADGGGVAGHDLVHLHSLFLWPTAAAARAAERAAVPYLVAPRGMLVEELFARRGRLRKRLWLALVERRTLERAAGLHVTGAVEAAEARRFRLRLPPLYEVPNGIDPDELAEPAAEEVSPALRQILAAGPYLLALGRLSWKKGLDRLVEALPLLAGPQGTGPRLVVAGNDEEGLLPRLAARAAAAGVADRFVYAGPVAGADKAALLRRALLLALPSYSENFGNVVLEAMAVGTPVVVTPEVGLAPAVAEAGAGVVTSGEPTVLAAALAALAGDPERRRELGRRGAEAVRQRFTWPAVAARMEEVYREVLDGRREG